MRLEAIRLVICTDQVELVKSTCLKHCQDLCILFSGNKCWFSCFGVVLQPELLIAWFPCFCQLNCLSSFGILQVYILSVPSDCLDIEGELTCSNVLVRELLLHIQGSSSESKRWASSRQLCDG